MTRRDLLPAVAGALAGAGSVAAQTSGPVIKKGRLKQGVTRGVFGRGGMSLEEQCKVAAAMGCKGFDLIAVKDWPTLKKYGLVPSMANGGTGTISDALNRIENHAGLESTFREMIDTCAAQGAPNLITFSGNRRGMSDAQGMDNCVTFLNKVKAQAENKGVTICMELLNSKVNHKDYMCDKSAWGIEMCKRVNSPRVRLLYDIYHLQIMEGDICRTIKENIQYFAHFHTGGNPGRNEIDETNELNYRLVAQTIVEAGYQGFVSHEYGPRRDPLKSLEQALTIMDV